MKNCDFLHSEIFSYLAKIKGNAVNNGDFFEVPDFC
jgi:hypothetical protein